jgi:hypothetical protein
MTETIGKLFGGDNSAVKEQLAAQEKAQRTSLAQSINNEAEAAQDLASGRRHRGGRRLLSYLDDQGGGAAPLG